MRRTLVGLLGAIGLVLSACSASASSSTSTSSPPESDPGRPTQMPGVPSADVGRLIDITMDNFAFTPATITLRAGERVTLRFVNRSAIPHEFMAGRDVNPDGMGYRIDFFDGVDPVATGGMSGMEEEMGGGYELELQGGEIGEITFTVPDRPGTYEFGCFIPGHYQAGMRGTLVVEG